MRAARHGPGKSAPSFFLAPPDEIVHGRLRISNHRTAGALDEVVMPFSRPRDRLFSYFLRRFWNAGQQYFRETIDIREERLLRSAQATTGSCFQRFRLI